MNITSAGIAVALAVVIAIGLLFFGPALFSPLNPAAYQPTEASPSDTTNNPSAMEPVPTELTITDEVIGTGAEAKTGNTVTVNYVGQLTDGSVFDASANHGQPFSFTLGSGQVIKGWDQGIIGMKEGGKRKLVIPPDLAYGAGGAGDVIPPNATLIFQVEMVKVGQ